MSYMGKVSSPRRTEQRSQEDDDCEEEDEVTPTGRSGRPVLAATMEEADSDRSNSRNHTNTINSSTTSEQDQSLVGKIASNFLSNLSKLVRNAKEKIVSPKQGRNKRSLEVDLSGRQVREQLAAEPRKRPRSSIVDKEEEEEEEGEDEEDQDRTERAVMEQEQEEYADENDEEQVPKAHRNARTYEMVTKRRRLHEVELSVAAAPLPRSTIGMRASRAPIRSSKHTQTDRFDRFVAQTGRMERATSTVGQYRNARNDGRPTGRTSLFGRPASVASSDSVFRPYSIHSTLPTATVTSGAEPEDGAAGEPARPFAASKFGQGLADASGRMTSFLGNAHYRQRMESLQRGAVAKAFFSSHDEPAKSLYSSGSESSVSSRRPSFNRTLFGSVSSLSSGRIPPEYGGSPFYDGLTRYGGASAARTLATNVMVQRSAQPSNSTLVVRQDAATGTGRRREAGAEPPKAPEISSTSQRMRHILDTFSTNKKNGQPVPEQFLSNSSLGRELDELIDRSKQTNRIAYPYPDVHSPRILEMLQIMREQKSASILNEPVEYVPRPPAVPLMEYDVPLLPADRPASPSERRNLASETRPSLEASKAPEEPKQQLAHPLPNPEHLRGLPRFRWNPLSSQPVTAEVKRKAVNGNETTPTHDEQEQLVGAEDKRETEQQEQHEEAGEEHGESEEEAWDDTDLMEQEYEVKELCRSSTPIEGVQQFTFASPVALGEPMELEFNPSPTITFTFASPARCLDQDLEPKARTFQELMAESAGKWVCDMCMIRNEPEQQKCMACESAKPGKKPEQQLQLPAKNATHDSEPQTPSDLKLWLAMKKPVQQQQQPCACESAKPGKKPEQQLQLPAKNATHDSEPQTPSDLKLWLAMKKPVQQQQQPSSSAQPVRSFQELMAESAGKWVCDMCMIRNEPEQQKCMACESAKPGKKPEQQLQLPAKNATHDSEPQTPSDLKLWLAMKKPVQQQQQPSSSAQPVRSFQELMAESAGKWVCDMCMIRNEPEQQKCMACESAKPAKKPVQQQQQQQPLTSTTQPVRSFQELMAESAGKWVCDMCMIRNEPEQQKCMACESAKPAKKPEEQQQQPPAKNSSQDSEPHTSIEWKKMLAADSPFSKVPELKDGFQSIVEKMKASTWVCDTCTAQNPIEHGRCLCCEQDRPGGGGAGSAPGKASEAAVPVPKFTFGMPSFTPNTAANSTTIDTQSKEVKAAGITSTPSRTGGFLFGAFNGVDRGTSNSVAPAPAPAPATAPVPAGLFSFGAPANSSHPCPPAAAVVPEASSSKPSFSFTNTSTTVTSAAQPFVFGASPKVPSAISFQPLANSGSSMAQQQQFATATSVTGDSNAAPTSLFGLPSSTPVNFNFTTTSNWAESNPVFQFGGKSQPNPSAQISAGQSHQIARRKMIRASRRLQPR
uniref:Nuclear pore complex protein Nup153 n=1 Tax=Anopheles gambiae TaxID=7165 RepID=A0A1S4G8D3_ANOGA